MAIRGAPLGINSLAAGLGAWWHKEKQKSYMKSTTPVRGNEKEDGWKIFKYLLVQKYSSEL